MGTERNHRKSTGTCSFLIFCPGLLKDLSCLSDSLSSCSSLTEDKVFEEPQKAHRLRILLTESGNEYEVVNFFNLFELRVKMLSCNSLVQSLQAGPERSRAVCRAETFGLTCQCDVMLDYGENSFCFIDKSFSTLINLIYNRYNIY